MLKVNMRTGETEQCSLLDLMEGAGQAAGNHVG